MAPRFVAVLDVGKTNVKLVLHDLATGTDLAVRTRPNAVRAGPPYPHFDAEAIWTFLLDALGATAAAHRVDAITVTTHGAAAALLDADGGLALPLLDYEHTGPDETAAAYDALRPAFAETCSPRLPGGLNVGAQLHWLETAFPDAFARVRHVIPYPQYWAFRLCGVPASEPTSWGVHTDLWHPRAGGYSSLATARGWDQLMPPLRSAFDRLGPITPEVAARTGLAADTPVACGIHDSNASLLPHLLARRPPFAVVSTGTWVIVLAVGGDLAALDPGRDGLANVDAFGRPVPSARWMGGREFDLLADKDPAPPSPADLARVLAADIQVLPGFAPGCGPFPRNAGRWSVDPATLSAGERTAAASLYVGVMSAVALELIGAAGPVIVEGPFARNRLTVRALAAATGRTVIASAGTTGTAPGAALLALGPEARLEPPAGEGCEPPEDPGLAAYVRAWRAAADDGAGR